MPTIPPAASLRVARHLCRHRWRWLCAALALAAITIAGVPKLNLGHGYRHFIEHGDHALAVADAITTEVASGRETLTLMYRPGSGTMFESTSMMQLAKLADLASRLSHVESPQSLVSAHKLVRIADAAAHAPQYEAHRVVPLIYPDGLFDDAGLARLRQDVLSIPTVYGRLVARDGSSAAVILPFDLGQDPLQRITRLAGLQASLSRIEADLQGLRASDTLVLAGPPLFEFAVEEILISDLKTLAPTSLLVFVALLLFLFRSVASASIVMLVVLLACATTLGVVCWAGMQATILVFSGLILVSTLSIAEALHVMTTASMSRLGGLSATEAMVDSLDKNLWPIVTTSLTTLVGEAVLLYSSSPAIRDMGIVMMVGALFALLYSLTVLPALATLQRRPVQGWVIGLGGFFDRLADACTAHPARVLAAWGLVCAMILPGLLNLRSHDTMSGWFGSDTSFRQGLDVLGEGYVALGAIDVISRVTTSDREAFASLPRQSPALDRQSQFDQVLGGIGGIQSAITPSAAIQGFMQRTTQPDTGLVLTADVVKDAPSSSTPGLSTLEKGFLLTESGTGRDVWLHRLVDTGAASNAGMLQVAADVKAEASRLLPNETLVGGLPVVFATLGQSNMDSTFQGTLITAAAITLCLAVALRSVKGALTSLVPNVVPVALVFGLWGLVSGEVNLAATTVVSVALGIVVDDTTHIMMKHQRYMAEGHSALEASRMTIVHGAPPILVTTIILASGFLIMSRSDFALTSQQSMMIAASICVAVVFDLTLTPALLALTARRSTTSRRRST